MKKIIASLSLITLLVLSGCESFLEEKYPAEPVWQTVDQMEYAVALPYSTFGEGWSASWGIYSYYDMMSTDMASYTGLYINGPVYEFMNRQHRSVALESDKIGWVRSVYYKSYEAIAGCNDALYFLNNPEGRDIFPKDSQAKKDANIPRMKAELYFWRAYSYYYLGLLFTPPYDQGGDNSERVLPLKTDVFNPQNTKIGTTQEIWDQVISDLLIAQDLMPEDWDVNGRINYSTITGALARAYFYTGQYDEAAIECTDIIDHGGYALQADVNAAWNTAPGDDVAPEVIFNYLPSGNEDILRTHGILYNFSAINKTYVTATNGGRYIEADTVAGIEKNSWNQCTWVTAIVSNSMLNRIGWMVDPENGDYTPTQDALDDARLGNTWLRLEGYHPPRQWAEVAASKEEFFNNYESKNNSLDFPHVYLDKFYRGVSGSNTCAPVMRLPEFHLMRAACDIKGAGTGTALGDVNIVRLRAGLSQLGSVTEADIEREWIIELGGEGQYLPYLIAMQKPILPGDREGVAPVNPPYEGWYWRIPTEEVKLNAGYDGFDPNSN